MLKGPEFNPLSGSTEGLVFIYFLAQTKPVLRIDAKSKYLSCRILVIHYLIDIAEDFYILKQPYFPSFKLLNIISEHRESFQQSDGRKGSCGPAATSYFAKTGYDTSGYSGSSTGYGSTTTGYDGTIADYGSLNNGYGTGAMTTEGNLAESRGILSQRGANGGMQGRDQLSGRSLGSKGPLNFYSSRADEDSSSALQTEVTRIHRSAS